MQDTRQMRGSLTVTPPLTHHNGTTMSGRERPILLWQERLVEQPVVVDPGERMCRRADSLFVFKGEVL